MSSATETAEIIAAADRADWCDFMRRMGGALCKRAHRPLQIAYRAKEKAGRYGDQIKQVIGLWSFGYRDAIISRFRTWEIRQKMKVTELLPVNLSSSGSSTDAPLEFCQ